METTLLDGGKKFKRGIGRRGEDLHVRRKIERFKVLYELGKIITSEIRIKDLFLLINKKTNQIMKSERSTVFLFDPQKKELWSFVATGMESSEIRIPVGKGIAGWVFRNEDKVLSNDVYEDPRFYKSVDSESGFQTRNILCVPLMNSKGKCIGVLQALNRKFGFSKDDETYLFAISDYVTIALENAKLYDEIKTYAECLKKSIQLNESLERLKSQLTKFVPPSVVRMAEKEPDKLDMGKSSMEVSVLFVDVCDFSQITEAYAPELVNHMIENHFSRYLSCANKHGGEVNETSGDGVMVIFKSDTIQNHQIAAVMAGLDIVKANHRLNKEVLYPWGKVLLHLGISTGTGYVGTTRMKGTAGERWTYTASGFVTVLASRIGSISGNSRLYICEKTWKKVRRQCVGRYVGKWKLKNVSQKTPVYWVQDTLQKNGED